VIVSAWSILAFPSVTTVALLLFGAADALVCRRARADEGVRPSRKWLFPAIAVTGIALYTTTIGIQTFNMYRLGFSPYAPLVLAIVAALAATRAPKIAISALAVIVAFDLHLYRSRNLFDYALDPILVATATFWSLRRVFSRSSRRA
jgi:hypothetical protein